MRMSSGRTPAFRRMRGGGGTPRETIELPFQVRVPSVGCVMRPPAASSFGSSSKAGLPSSTKRRRATQDVLGPVSPSGMRFMRPPSSGPTVRKTSSLSFKPTLPTSSTSRAESRVVPGLAVVSRERMEPILNSMRRCLATGRLRPGGLEGGFLCYGFVRIRSERARRADAAHERELERGIERIDSEGEPEEVHLEAFDRACGEACEAEERELEAAPARGGPDELLARIVLADRGGRQIGLDLGHRAQHPGGEGIRVRTGPRGVFAGPRVGMRRLVDARDELIDPRAALLGDELGRRSEPAH